MQMYLQAQSLQKYLALAKGQYGGEKPKGQKNENERLKS